MTTPFKWGQEFQADLADIGLVGASSITAINNGHFVICWVDGSQTGGDSTGSAIKAQMFDANGTALGTEFLVNSTTDGEQYDPAVIALADGGFVVTWTSANSGGFSTIHAQAFANDGTATGPENAISPSSFDGQYETAAAALSEGGYVVTWTSFDFGGSDPFSYNIRAQIFTHDGQPSGTDFIVNSTLANWQVRPSVTALVNGNFVVAWRDDSQTGGDVSEFAVRAQIVSASGVAVGPEILVNTTTLSYQWNPSVTGLANGGFVVAWEDQSQTGGDTSSYAVRAQVFSADGTAFGSEMLVNSSTLSHQNSPSIVGLADGRFVVVWQDFSLAGGDSSGTSVKGQLFDADGTRSGGEFLVNTFTGGDQYEPSLTALSDGRFVVAWTSWDSIDTTIAAQIFDPREAAILLNGTLDDDDFVGTIFADQLSGGYGNDRLAGGLGDDILNGSLGKDLLIGDAGNDRLSGSEGNDLLFGNGGSDSLDGGLGNDSLNGASGADGLFGGDGNDTLIGGSGADLLFGGIGNDRIVIADTDLSNLDLYDGGGGFDSVVLSATPGNLADFRLAGITLIGIERVALLAPPGQGVSLTMSVSQALRFTTIDGLANPATPDLLVLTTSGLPILDLSAVNAINFNAWTVIGSAKADVVTGFGAPSEIRVSAGDDTVIGGSGGDSILGGDGRDSLSGGAGTDLLYGGKSNDFLLGDAGDDTLSGSAGNDFLFGGDGNDRLETENGGGRMHGGLGNDVFELQLSNDQDVSTVLDFTSGQDQIDLAQFSISDFATAMLSFRNVGADLVFDAGFGSIIILNTQLSQLSAIDLIL